MKKLSNIMAMILVIVMLLSAITSCNVADKPGDKDTTVGTPGKETNASPETTAITIDETVLVDENGVKITALSLDENDPLKMNISIENNSGMDIRVAATRDNIGGLYSYVNDCSVDIWLDDTNNLVSVKNGEKTYNKLIFNVWDEMKKYVMKDGIVADLEMAFRVTDSQEGNMKYWDGENDWQTEQIKVKTSAADKYDYTFDDSGVLLYDENGVKIVYKEIYHDGYPTVLFTVDNSSDMAKKVIVDEFVSEINGCSAAPSLQSYFPFLDAGKKAVGIYRFSGFNRGDTEPDCEIFEYDGNIESINNITTVFEIGDIFQEGTEHYDKSDLITLNFDWQSGKPEVTLVTEDVK